MKQKKALWTKKITKWFMKNKKNIFIILGIFFSIIGIISLYNNFVRWRSWFDLIIAILMLFLWFCFFPFSYSWQERVFGSSLFNVTPFTATMFGVFIGLTISIFQEIFQWDFEFTIWTSISLIIVVLWWSLIVPVTRHQRQKHLGHHSILLWRKIIFFVFVLWGSIGFVINISHSNSWSSSIAWTDTYHNHYSVCWSTHVQTHPDNNIDVYITNSEIPAEWKITTNTFSPKELAGLQYYIEGQSSKKPYYFSREICNLDTHQSLLDMFDGWIQVDAIGPDTVAWQMGNLSPFSTIVFKTWHYSLNVFSSEDNNHRQLVKTIEFSVE